MKCYECGVDNAVARDFCAGCGSPTNSGRVRKVRSLLRGYCGDSDDLCDVKDALTDIMHWCDFDGMSFEDLLNTARSHYEYEREE